MANSIIEYPISSECFIELMNGFIDYLLPLLANKVWALSGIRAFFKDEVLKIAGVEFSIKRKLRLYKKYTTAGYPPVVEFSFQGGSTEEYIPGMAFYYDIDNMVHTFVLLHKLTDANRFKDHIYAYYFSYPEFRLKLLYNYNFINLLADELVFQIIWGHSELRKLFLDRAFPLFKKRLLKELESKDYAHNFRCKGFLIYKFHVYVKCRYSDNRLLPEEDRAIHVVLMDLKESEFLSVYHRRFELYCTVEGDEALFMPMYWRYARNSEMEELLIESGFGDYRRYIHFGKKAAMVERKTVEMRDFCLALLTNEREMELSANKSDDQSPVQKSSNLFAE